MDGNTFTGELKLAREKGYAIGAFNIFNYLSARAVIEGAADLDSPVILQTSVTTVKAIGTAALGNMLRQLKDTAPVNVLIHLDHCQDVELAKACVDAGWDSVMYDGSRLPLEENIRNCKEVADYAHQKGVDVEGELGTIGGVEDAIRVDSDAAVGADFDESLYFVKASGIDVFAPAIGTAHGMYKGVPKINFDLVKRLDEALDCPLVVHGGTGLSEDTFVRLVRCGASKINVSTALKQAYVGGCKDYLAEKPDKLDPLDLDRYLAGRIKDTAVKHMEIFRRNMNG